MEQVLIEAMERLPGCVAAGIADARRGTLQAAISADARHAERLEVAAMAGATLFESGRAARTTATLVPSPAEADPLPREAMLVSSGEVNVIQRVGTAGDRLLVLLCASAPTFAGRILTESRALAASANAAASPRPA